MFHPLRVTKSTYIIQREWALDSSSRNTVLRVSLVSNTFSNKYNRDKSIQSTLHPCHKQIRINTDRERTCNNTTSMHYYYHSSLQIASELTVNIFFHIDSCPRWGQFFISIVQSGVVQELGSANMSEDRCPSSYWSSTGEGVWNCHRMSGRKRWSCPYL